MAKRWDSDPEYKRNRAEILKDKPLCHWGCGKLATTADHLTERAIGGTNDLSNMVASCLNCNSIRGASFQARRKAQQQQARNAFLSATPPTPTHINQPYLGLNQPELELTGEGVSDDWRIGRERPRLESIQNGDDTYGPLVAAWAEKYMGIKCLMPWQIHALSGQLRHSDGALKYRESLVSTARQNGKSVALQALIGWWLTEGVALRGGPQSVMSVANKLDRAEAIFTALAHILKDNFGAKLVMAVGRKQVTMLDGSTWEVRAATKSLHGGSHDLIVVDELWDIDSEVVDDALRPSQIARKSPLLSMWSTAGDQSSTTMISLRSQAIADIDRGVTSPLYFAEWSMGNLNPADKRNWYWANPALGETITIEALEAVSKKDSFLRSHLNQWISARGAWLDSGVWDKCLSDVEMPDGGCLSVDSSLDDNRFVGVRAAIVDGITHVKVEFVAETETDLWLEVDRVMATPLTQLLITPTLMLHLPTALQRRTTQVGYAELTKYTSLVRSMIYEQRVAHHGEVLLDEHCSRAVLVKTPTGAVLSSQKSPGPIELCRTMVWAVAEVSRPKAANRPHMVIV